MTTVTPLARHVLDTLRPIPNYPKPGIIFQDITPVLRDGPLFRAIVEAMADPFREADVTHVLGIEARGFILGGAVATNLGAGFVPARKPGKLPWERVAETYDLEYGTDSLECHRDGLPESARVLDRGRRVGDRRHRPGRRPAGAGPGCGSGGLELPAGDRRAGRAGEASGGGGARPGAAVGGSRRPAAVGFRAVVQWVTIPAGRAPGGVRQDPPP